MQISRPGKGRFQLTGVRLRACSDEIEAPLQRHARACRGHPRLSCGLAAKKTWMAGTRPAMTPNKWFNMTKTRARSRSTLSTSFVFASCAVATLALSPALAEGGLPEPGLPTQPADASPRELRVL